MFWYGIFSVCCITQIVIKLFNIEDVLNILWGIIPIIYAIKNIILNIKSKQNKINLIVYFLVILYSIVFLLKNFEIIDITIYNETWAVVAIIMQLIYIHKQEDVQITNKRKIFNIILYNIFFTMLIILTAVILVFKLSDLYKKTDETKQFIDDIAINLSNFNSMNNLETYIKVQNDGKWGYINKKGKEIIPCEYNILTQFWEISVNKRKYLITLAVKNDQYLIITNQNETIDIPKNIITTLKYLISNANEETIIGHIIQTINSYNTENSIINNENEEQQKQDNKIVLYEEDNGTYIYKNNNDDFNIIFERYYPSDIQPDVYNIYFNKSDGTIETYFEYIPSYTSSNNLVIYTYRDGHIPFYNYETKLQGWYTQNAEKTEISGQYQIVEVKNNIITLRTYNKENVYFANIQGEILFQAKEVVLYDEGYIIRKENGKIVFLDNEINEITKEYEYIVPIFDYYDNTIIMLVGININENGEQQKFLIDLKGNILTDKTYEYIEAYNYEIEKDMVYGYINGSKYEINFEDELTSNSITDNIPYELEENKNK